MARLPRVVLKQLPRRRQTPPAAQGEHRCPPPARPPWPGGDTDGWGRNRRWLEFFLVLAVLGISRGPPCCPHAAPVPRRRLGHSSLSSQTGRHLEGPGEPRATAGLPQGRSSPEPPWAWRERDVGMGGAGQGHRGQPLLMHSWELWVQATEPLVSVAVPALAGVPCLGLDVPILS